ncbi:hypothetical protein QL285_089465 [Trifolium repens]|nr:hypothetical protein QL285_089465 [Trifolium repens]
MDDRISQLPDDILSYILTMLSIKDANLMLVDCLKLTSLECLGSDLSTLNIYTHVHVLKRIDFSVSMEEFLDAFALCATFPELEIMRVEIYTMVVTTSLNIAQPLKHLKQLDCIIDLCFVEDCDLMVILNILQASPLLQKLSVTIEEPRLFEEQYDIRDVEVSSHNELKVIELGGCVSNWFEIEFVMNVLKYTNKLEQIVVSPYWRYGSNPVWFQGGRERMIEKLQGENVVGKEKLVFI